MIFDWLWKFEIQYFFLEKLLFFRDFISLEKMTFLIENDCELFLETFLCNLAYLFKVLFFKEMIILQKSLSVNDTHTSWP